MRTVTAVDAVTSLLLPILILVCRSGSPSLGPCSLVSKKITLLAWFLHLCSCNSSFLTNKCAQKRKAKERADKAKLEAAHAEKLALEEALKAEEKLKTKVVEAKMFVF